MNFLGLCQRLVFQPFQDLVVFGLDGLFGKFLAGLGPKTHPTFDNVFVRFHHSCSQTRPDFAYTFHDSRSAFTPACLNQNIYMGIVLRAAKEVLHPFIIIIGPCALFHQVRRRRAVNILR